MLHFYDVEGLLVRRWVPAQRRIAMEVWNANGWALYPDVDNVSRRGHRLTDEQALALLQETCERSGPLARPSDADAAVALRSRLKRG